MIDHGMASEAGCLSAGISPAAGRGWFSRVPVWGRLGFLVGTALLGLLGLAAVALAQFSLLKQESEALQASLPALRSTQKILTMGLETRSQLMLALQHNPGTPEIARLHDHSAQIHLDAARAASERLRTEYSLLCREAVEQAISAACGSLAGSLAGFVTEGVEPVLKLLVEGRFTDANIALLVNTNPGYGKLRDAATQAADLIANGAAARSAEVAGRLAFFPYAVSAGLLATAVFCLLLGVLVARSITRQIGGEPRTGGAIMARVAGGDLRGEHPAFPGSMLAALGYMVARLRAMLAEIRGNSGSLMAQAVAMRQTMAEIAQSAECQAAATSGIAAAVEELTTSINHIAETARETEGDARRSAGEARQGREYTGKMGRAMATIGQQLHEIGEHVQRLDRGSEKISGIALLIGEVAEQTNLLALNAAIEAARAGETGRGFAVVADEVRKLAERTSRATLEITELVDGFGHETRVTVAVMEAALPHVRQSSELIQLSESALARIQHNAETISGRVHEIAEATSEQSSVSTSIAQEIENIAAVAEEANNAMQQTMSTVASVEARAVSLEAEVSVFRL